jgi:hypothetical protein
MACRSCMNEGEGVLQPICPSTQHFRKCLLRRTARKTRKLRLPHSKPTELWNCWVARIFLAKRCSGWHNVHMNIATLKSHLPSGRMAEARPVSICSCHVVVLNPVRPGERQETIQRGQTRLRKGTAVCSPTGEPCDLCTHPVLTVLTPERLLASRYSRTGVFGKSGTQSTQSTQFDAKPVHKVHTVDQPHSPAGGAGRGLVEFWSLRVG